MDYSPPLSLPSPSSAVWVAPDRIAHLLVDFPQILIKKEVSCLSVLQTHKTSFTLLLLLQRNARNLSFDPRAEDIVAVYELYRKVLLPHINHGSSWVSMKQ